MTIRPEGTTSRHDEAHAARRTDAVGDVDLRSPLDALLSEVGLSREPTGGSVTFAGRDPIVPSAHRLGACIGVPLMAGAAARLAFHRLRGGPAQITVSRRLRHRVPGAPRVPATEANSRLSWVLPRAAEEPARRTGNDHDEAP